MMHHLFSLFFFSFFSRSLEPLGFYLLVVLSFIEEACQDQASGRRILEDPFGHNRDMHLR
jgi:hypothetical protein